MDERLHRIGRNQIGLADENLVGKAHLAARLLPLVELLRGVLGVHQGHDRVEQVALGNLVVHEKRLRHRPRIGQPGGLDDHAIEGQQPLAPLVRQQRQRAAQVFADGAAHAAVAHLHDLFLGVGHQDLVVDVFGAELVFDHGDALPVRLGEHALEQRGLARA